MGINPDMEPFSLPDDRLTLLNAEPNGKQPMKCTYFKGLAFQAHNSDNEQIIGALEQFPSTT
jgi:hypothetical protein